MASSNSSRKGAHFSGPQDPSETSELTPRSSAEDVPMTPAAGADDAPVHADVPVITSSGGARMASSGVSAATARLTVSAGKHAGAPRKRQRGGAGGIVVVLVLLALLAGGVYLLRDRIFATGGTQEVAPAVEAGQEVLVNVPEGAGASLVAESLVEAGVISDMSSFLTALQRQGAEQSIKPGTYSFLTGASANEVVRQLVAGPNTTAGILSVPEGLTLARTAALVEDQFGISADEFVAQAQTQNYVGEFPFLAAAEDATLEGFLFPKTYDFSGKEVTADLVIRTMLTQYQLEVGELDMAAAEAAIKERYGVTMDDYDILTLASIIEREAVTEEDRPLVSSVFYNRLRQGMALQSDATMGYVTGGAVTPEDLQQDSPYNTYLYAGLTPTPICSPSMECIRAAMEPADTNYLYFFIVENESYSDHSFSETYEEHQAAINASVQAQG